MTVERLQQTMKGVVLNYTTLRKMRQSQTAPDSALADPTAHLIGGSFPPMSEMVMAGATAVGIHTAPLLQGLGWFGKTLTRKDAIKVDFSPVP